jgi:hypothetical protein
MPKEVSLSVLLEDSLEVFSLSLKGFSTVAAAYDEKKLLSLTLRSL